MSSAGARLSRGLSGAGSQVVDGGSREERGPREVSVSAAAAAMEEPQPLPQSELPLCDSLIIWVSERVRSRRGT